MARTRPKPLIASGAAEGLVFLKAVQESFRIQKNSAKFRKIGYIQLSTSPRFPTDFDLASGYDFEE
jgi:hypothetical protein